MLSEQKTYKYYKILKSVPEIRLTEGDTIYQHTSGKWIDSKNNTVLSDIDINDTSVFQEETFTTPVKPGDCIRYDCINPDPFIDYWSPVQQNKSIEPQTGYVVEIHQFCCVVHPTNTSPNTKVHVLYTKNLTVFDRYYFIDTNNKIKSNLIDKNKSKAEYHKTLGNFFYTKEEAQNTLKSKKFKDISTSSKKYSATSVYVLTYSGEDKNTYLPETYIGLDVDDYAYIDKPYMTDYFPAAKMLNSKQDAIEFRKSVIELLKIKEPGKLCIKRIFLQTGL